VLLAERKTGLSIVRSPRIEMSHPASATAGDRKFFSAL
jgi:hypothetical protein